MYYDNAVRICHHNAVGINVFKIIRKMQEEVSFLPAFLLTVLTEVPIYDIRNHVKLLLGIICHPLSHRPLQSHLCKLRMIKLLIIPLFPKQFLMGSLFHDIAVPHHKD